MSKLIDENGVATLIELVKKQTPNTYSKQEIDALVNQNRVSVDSSLSTSSPNPVSNRVVTSELSKKLNSTSVAQVALTGSYNDLKDKPSVEEAVPLHIRSITQLDITNWNNKQDVISDLETIRSKANSAILTMPDWTKLTNKPTYTASEVGALPDSTEIPTKISDLTNDSSFLTEETDPVFNASPASEITSSDITNWNNKLDAFTETDPIYSASPAASITSTDISNWNSKTDNVGTITGINMNGASKGTSGVVDLGTVLTEHLDLTNYVTTNTDLNVTGTKTFVGTKKVKFKQSTNNDKLGFTLLSSSSSSDNELGYLEYNPTGRRLTLGFYRPSTGAITPTSVGFTHTDLKSGASYYLFAPLSNNAKSKYNLNNTAKTFYLPLGITDGTNTVLTDNTGTIDISTLKPSNVYSKSEVDNLCPIIEDTRSNAEATITGNAPFSELVDGQRIILRLALNINNSCTLRLTLSGGNTTIAYPVYAARNAYIGGIQLGWASYGAGAILEMIFDGTRNRWMCISSLDTNTTYSNITNSEITTGTSTLSRVVTPQVLRNNFYLKSETDNLVANKQNKRTVEYPTITADWGYSDYGMPFSQQVLEDALDAYYADWRNEANAVALCNALAGGNGMQGVELSRVTHSAFIYVGVEFDVSGESDTFYAYNEVNNNLSLTTTNYVVFGRTDSLAPIIADVDYTEADEFLFSFTCSTDNCSLTLPSGINYGNGLDFDTDKKANRKFQVSISDGIALYAYVDPQNS